MLRVLRDSFATFALRRRFQRLAGERALALLEASSCSPCPVPRETPSDGRWVQVGGLPGNDERPLDQLDKAELRRLARHLVATNPHARNCLRLLGAYVVGPDMRTGFIDRRTANGQSEASRRAAALWRRFLAGNCGHFSYSEFATRTWRDGEAFVRLFPQASWPPAVRFIDPERIGATPGTDSADGIVTDPDDAETVKAYLHVNAAGELVEEIPAAELLHAKINADSNEARGTSLFATMIGPLQRYERWLETELVARKVAASVVLWRKVMGGGRGSAGDDPNDTLYTTQLDPAKFQPGSVLTTDEQQELQFLNPQSELDDAAPLGRLLLLAAAAGAGMPEYMLTGDSSAANYSKSLVAEGPPVRLFVAEQHALADRLNRLWQMVAAEAVRLGLLTGDDVAALEPDWHLPSPAFRDRPRERYADVRLVAAGVLSRSEVARRENVDPATMRAELAAEARPLVPPKAPPT